jgi:hypothetical protein
MGISAFLNRACNQTAVYWGNPVDNGNGGFTYDDPVEIKCHWEEKEQLLSQANSTPLISRSIVYLIQDVDVDGLLYLGELTDLDSAEEANPYAMESGVCIIKRFEKTPAMGSTTEFVRKAFLTPWLT